MLDGIVGIAMCHFDVIIWQDLGGCPIISVGRFSDYSGTLSHCRTIQSHTKKVSCQGQTVTIGVIYFVIREYWMLGSYNRSDSPRVLLNLKTASKMKHIILSDGTSWELLFLVFVCFDYPHVVTHIGVICFTFFLLWSFTNGIILLLC